MEATVSARRPGPGAKWETFVAAGGVDGPTQASARQAQGATRDNQSAARERPARAGLTIRRWKSPEEYSPDWCALLPHAVVQQFYGAAILRGSNSTGSTEKQFLGKKKPRMTGAYILWAMRDLNPRPLPCEGSALPAAPIAQIALHQRPKLLLRLLILAHTARSSHIDDAPGVAHNAELAAGAPALPGATRRKWLGLVSVLQFG